MPWDSIQYVTSGFTLVAFVVAAIAWGYKRYADRQRRLIQLAKEDDRAQLVSNALEFFHIDTEGLTKDQKFQLALEQIRRRAERFRIGAMVVLVLAIVSAVLTGFLFVQRSSGKSPANTAISPPVDKNPPGDLEAHLQTLSFEDLHDQTLAFSFELDRLQSSYDTDFKAAEFLVNEQYRQNQLQDVRENYENKFRSNYLRQVLVFNRELKRRDHSGLPNHYHDAKFDDDIHSALLGQIKFVESGRTVVFGELGDYFKERAETIAP